MGRFFGFIIATLLALIPVAVILAYVGFWVFLAYAIIHFILKVW